VFAFHINALLLERWFLKTAINLFAAHASKEWWADPTDRVTEPLLNVIFRGAPLPFPAGLYAYQHYEAEHSSADSVEYHLLSVPGDRILGHIFDFRGYRFLLWLSNQFGPHRFVAPNEAEHLKHHPGAITHVLNGYLSHIVRFHWESAA
jgi:hypothetical protein